ncbi:alkyl sulfatase C-terminal domain-containing protein [Streptomyces sp. NPDC023723]|uniref:alkyl sulfatase C-terminal domain-containing protein n=1 Tax=Streptomyces sp. NPDC023723 TaxID=3154323 RepID=UPI0034065CE0
MRYGRAEPPDPVPTVDPAVCRSSRPPGSWSTRPARTSSRGEAPDVTLRPARPVLDEVVGHRTTFADAIGAGRIAVTGEVAALITFGGLMERPGPRFAIGTP